MGSGCVRYAIRRRLNTIRELWFFLLIESKIRGCKFYNFGAISLAGENDHWKTISIFKQKFGGHIISHSPFLDLVQNSFWYYIYIVRKLIKSII